MSTTHADPKGIRGARVAPSRRPGVSPPGYTARRAMREMTVYGVSLDMRSRQPIVLLKTTDDDVYVPVWVGHSEAAAILMKLQDSEPPRPLTHDLACCLVDSLDGRIVRVTVTGLRDNTFHATSPSRRTVARSRSTPARPTRSPWRSAPARRSSRRTRSSRSRGGVRGR